MRMKRGKRIGIVVATGVGLAVTTSIAHGEIKYVSANASPGGDGDSWATAYNDLKIGLGAMSEGDVLRVGQGTYKPHADDRDEAFAIAKITVRGGFAGTGTADPDAWNPALYPTILSGEIGNQSSTADNSHHVVVLSNPEATVLNTLLEGVTITSGSTEGSNVHGGAGIWIAFGAKPRIQNCVIEFNRAPGGLEEYFGGGVHAFAESPEITAPVFINCTFSNNLGGSVGGGLYAHDSCIVKLISCTFVNNSAGCGPAVAAVSNAEVEMINCLVAENVFLSGCLATGGAIHITSGGKATLKSCTITSHGNGAALYQDGGGPSYIHNSVIWDNGGIHLGTGELHIEDSDIEGGENAVGPSSPTTYANNLDADPDFMAPSSGDFRLSCGSPCINVGNDNLVPCDTYDIDGNGAMCGPTPPPQPTPDRDLRSRVVGSAVDMGAYERQQHPCDADLNSDGNVNATDLLSLINQWGSCSSCSADIHPGPCGDGDGSVGVQDLLLLINAWGSNCASGIAAGLPQEISDCWTQFCNGLNDTECVEKCVEAYCSQDPRPADCPEE